MHSRRDVTLQLPETANIVLAELYSIRQEVLEMRDYALLLGGEGGR
jgi:hypothetical protein